MFTAARSSGASRGPVPIVGNAPTPQQSSADDDGWGADAPPVTRTQLEKVQPAYQPTKISMHDFKSEKPSVSDNKPEEADVVKGGYQPVGKVDIAAIRRQAQEAGEMKDDRPTPVKGSYEPVGKVDIGAIRSRAQPPPETAASGAPAETPPVNEPEPEPARTISFNPSERMTSMPKPKVGNKFGGGPAFGGTKPPLPSDFSAKPTPAAAQVGSASRTFADQGGKTPAQQWAEKKAREAGTAAPSYGHAEPPVQRQESGQSGWKSSYTGKQWAPVQTTHTGKSARSESSQHAADVTADNEPTYESEPPRQSVGAIRDQLAQEQKPREVGDVQRAVPIPGLPPGPTQPESGYEPEPPQDIPEPPPQPRSPTPPGPDPAHEEPVQQGSPIQVAMPVGRGVSDAHEEQRSPPPAIPAESLNRAVPDEKELEDDMGRETAQASAADHTQGGGIRAVAQYDYEKAEGNEIDIREGEYVTQIEMIDQDWWVGVNDAGDRGLFPSNYVELVEGDGSAAGTGAPEPEPPAPVPARAASPSPPPAPRSAGGPVATSLYDYEAAEDNELSFPEDAKITNIVSEPLLSNTWLTV